jgi:hypothetical protein
MDEIAERRRKKEEAEKLAAAAFPNDLPFLSLEELEAHREEVLELIAAGGEILAGLDAEIARRTTNQGA